MAAVELIRIRYKFANRKYLFVLDCWVHMKNYETSMMFHQTEQWSHYSVVRREWQCRAVAAVAIDAADKVAVQLTDYFHSGQADRNTHDAGPRLVIQRLRYDRM